MNESNLLLPGHDGNESTGSYSSPPYSLLIIFTWLYLEQVLLKQMCIKIMFWAIVQAEETLQGNNYLLDTNSWNKCMQPHIYQP